MPEPLPPDSLSLRQPAGRWGALGFVVGMLLSVAVGAAAAPALGEATADSLALGVAVGGVYAGMMYAGDRRRLRGALAAWALCAALAVPVGWALDRVWPR